jgi:hypothetical protein
MKLLLFLLILSSLPLLNLAQDGYFGEIKINANVGQKDEIFRRYPFGIGFLTTHGYGFKNWFGIAGGTGIIHESSDYATFSPFFFQISSAPLKKKLSPHASMDLGYAHQWKKGREDEFTKIKGGIYIHPQIGVKIGTKEKFYAVIGIGWARFDSKIIYQLSGSPDRTVTTKSYKRYTFNLAIGF